MVNQWISGVQIWGHYHTKEHHLIFIFGHLILPWVASFCEIFGTSWSVHIIRKTGIQEIFMDVKAIPMATHCQAFLFRVFWGTIPALIKHHTSCWGCLIFAIGVGAVCGWKWWPSGWCQLQLVHLQSCWYLMSHLDESKFCEKWGSSQNRCAQIPDIPFFTRIWVAKKGHPERQIAENYQRDCLIVSFHGKSCQQFRR